MANIDDPAFGKILKTFASKLTGKYQAHFEGQDEDQLKAPVETVLQSFGKLLGLEVLAKTESRVEDIGRPDIGVAVDGLLTGHVELKAPGKGALPTKYKGQDREQWKRYQALPNLIYTDGNEFTLYREGERQARVILKGDIRTDGAESVSEKNVRDLRDLVAMFFDWQPIVPRNPKALAETLAPFCHILRDDVLAAVQDEKSGLATLAADWRRYLFPDADDAQFADAYAQTLTYSLLLARVGGAENMEPHNAAKALDTGHSLLAQALRVLSDPHISDEIGLGVELLTRVIEAVDPEAIGAGGSDPWLYFYEDFLAAYDPKLRNDRGVYYTPVEVVKAQVRLVSQLLREGFDKNLSFADDGVVLLDPAVGTGTYPLAAFEHGSRLVAERYGEGATGARATEMAKNFHAFELLVGPYAVAHLRLTQAIQKSKGVLPADGAHVYLTDTLESPHATPPGQQTFFHKELAEEHKRAQEVKANTRVLVCMGNPPYDRQQIDPDAVGVERKGGWVRYGDTEGDRAILEDFLEPARDAGQGVHLKNLYNDYVYFWRWALWKVFEQTEDAGIVSFITASSYLRGPGFVGMRRLMREVFDELWIIDLEGDNLGARKTENVFAIQTPVAIAVGVRSGEPNPNTAAKVRYTRITGTRAEKLSQLDNIEDFAALEWRDCFTSWPEPFLPEGEGDYYSWPLLTDVFPWQYSGVQYKRTWPIAETKDLLTERWKALLAADDQKAALRETSSRRVNKTYRDLDGVELPAISTLDAGEPPHRLTRYSFRSFDRQWAIADPRLCDRIRPALWSSHSDYQVYMTSLLTNVLGLGPAAVAAAHIPDLDHFRGSFGAKHAVPLWRDAGRTLPNVTGGLLDVLSGTLEMQVGPKDLFAYVYGILAGPAYVESFSEELTVPGPRIPIAKDPDLFEKVAALGRRLIWLHTYGERFVPDGAPAGNMPRGAARVDKGIPTDPGKYPTDYQYDEETRELRVGEGVIKPVRPEVRNFSVSGLEVVKSWLDYRMKDRAGKASSPLDGIRPTQWTAQMTEELLELIWVLEETIDSYPEHAELLAAVIESNVFAAEELPEPTDNEREAPEVGEGAPSNQDSLFG